MAIFAARCAYCHDNPDVGAPAREVLAAFEPGHIVEALTTGKMVDNAAGLTPEQKQAVAAFLTAKPATDGSAAGSTPTPPTKP